ncbi:MAG: hypothetical protein KDD22_06275 [Bdellovibrionales bacterium]|nr:hypothetical protein [Bdellovibrionales bacterium]
MQSIFKGLFVVIGLWGAQVLAQIPMDVTCKDGDCLRYGWNVNDTYGRYLGEALCVNGDCSTFGWHEIIAGRPTQEVVCTDNSCFGSGWVHRDHRGDWLHELTCDIDHSGETYPARNCLKYGWTVRHRQGGATRSECTHQDCTLYGWTTRYDNGVVETVSCLGGGCFVTGWTVRFSHH